MSGLHQLIKAHRNKIIILFHHITLIAGLWYVNFELPYVIVSIISGYLGFAIFGQGAHLYIAHRPYNPTWYNNLYVFLINTFTASGGALNFTALHRHHHRYTDTEKDPHSPTHIGWWRVYFLMYEHINISPASVRDIAKSKFVIFLHKHQVKLHFVGVFLLSLIDIRLLFFVISPSVVQTVHTNGCVNWLGHKNGKPRNIPEIAWLTPLSWRHGDHHNHKYEK